MASEEDKDKFCGESDELLDVGGKTAVEPSAEENGAQGNVGKSANELKVSDKGTQEKKGTKLGAGDGKRSNIRARKSVKTRPDKWEVTNPDPQNGESGVIPSKQSSEEGSNERAQQRETIQTSDLGTKSQSSYLPRVVIFLVRAVAILIVFAFACNVVTTYIGPPKDDMKSDFDLAKGFENGLKKLRSKFTNQTDRFWKILRNRGLAHLRKKNPSQPLVYLLAAPPAAHEWVDCLAVKVAEELDPRHKKTLFIIDGEKERANPPDDTKKRMDNSLKKQFEAGHRVALIHHLELLPPPSPLLFYSYCDDQNAPHKGVAVIFTVHMPVEPSPSLSPKEEEGSVEKYLAGEVWVNDDKDAVAALLSRIADTVVLMRGESSGSATDLCSDV